MGSNLVRREHPPLPRGPFENWRLAASAGHHPTPSVPLCEHRHLPFCLLSRFHKRCSSEPTWLTVKLPRGWGWLGTVGCLAWVVLGFWVRDETQNPWAGESIQAALVGAFCEHAKRNPGFPGGSDGKESSCNVEDLGSVPGLG